MYSISDKEWIGALFGDLDKASSRGATFPELMALLDCYERLRREFAALEYELASPFARPW